MAVRINIFIRCISLILCLCTAPIHAQILRDSSSFRLIKKGIEYVYNFQFKEADVVYGKINQSYPGHPVVHLFKGMITYWENYPLLPASPARALFEKELRTCMELSEKKHDPADEAEYLLANLCARGLLLLYYSDNELDLEVFPLATSTYQYVRRAFDFTSVYPDFNFFTGIYDYYREVYPEAYPAYKPLAILFPKGDKAKGLKELQVAAENSIALKAESFSFLSYIYISFENNFTQATYYNKSLHELYPANLEYMGDYIKNLLLLKQYDEAEKLILSPGSKTNNSYYQAQLTIFNGILKEKKYHDYKQAQELYTTGIRDISIFGKYGNELAAYGYFGLSRISDANGDKHYKKIYRKLANDLADFKKINFD